MRDEEASSRAVAEFADRFGRHPEGVWAAPGRVNVIGEHTDYNDGFVLPVALPHTTRAAVALRTDGRADRSPGVGGTAEEVVLPRWGTRTRT